MSVNRRSFLAATAASLAGLGRARGAKARDRKLVLIAGTPSHGPGEHEFNAGVRVLHGCLKRVPGLETIACHDGFPKDASILEGADGILCYADGGGGHPLIQARRLDTIAALMAKGAGLMCAHYGVEVPADKGGKRFQDWIGGYYEHLWSCNPMWSPEFTRFPDHPITRGVRPFSVRDEWYINMRFRPDMTGVTPILSAPPSDAVRNGPYVYPKGPYPHIQQAKGKSEAMMWAVERPDGGRGVGFTGGHFHRNWSDPNFRKVVLNALLWICKVEVPAGGVESNPTEAELTQGLDPKPARR